MEYIMLADGSLIQEEDEMRVGKKRRNPAVNLVDVASGECVLIGNDYYITICETTSNIETVRLKDGQFEIFDKDTLVFEVDAEVVVND